MTFINSARFRAEQYHKALPEEIRRYLQGRGIADTIIDRQLLGWDGKRISIPIFGREGEILTFRFAKLPADKSQDPKAVISEVGSCPELYGWDALAREPHTVVICEGEFARLVLESRAYAAVASTAGAAAFLPDWAPRFANVARVYIAFDRDQAGEAAARNVKSLLPRAKIVRMPAEVRDTHGVTNFFVRLGRTRVDFDLLLAAAAVNADDDDDPAFPHAKRLSPVVSHRADSLKRAVPLADIARRYTALRPAGAKLVGRCPFCENRSPSFSVDPRTNKYDCSACGAQGDVVTFVMQQQSMTFGQALEALEHYRYTNEL